jgi:hypothetical protein
MERTKWEALRVIERYEYMWKWDREILFNVENILYRDWKMRGGMGNS